jgi:hypothetical protein
MLLRLVGRGGRSRVEKEIVLPIDEMSDEWLVKTFFAIKKEGMRRNIISRHGYRKRREVQGIQATDHSAGQEVAGKGSL